jgi:hypothetical protein
MASGGARNRSGPQADPNSLTSGKRGLSLQTLPSVGYEGEIPDMPLADLTDRESEVWAQLWRTPQATAWIAEPWRWRTVAMYVRWSVRSEGDVPAAFLGQVHRLGDQIGLTPAGLKENGWAIAPVESTAAAATPKRKVSSRARLKVVGNDG